MHCCRSWNQGLVCSSNAVFTAIWVPPHRFYRQPRFLPHRAKRPCASMWEPVHVQLVLLLLLLCFEVFFCSLSCFASICLCLLNRFGLPRSFLLFFYRLLFCLLFLSVPISHLFSFGFGVSSWLRDWKGCSSSSWSSMRTKTKGFSFVWAWPEVSCSGPTFSGGWCHASSEACF